MFALPQKMRMTEAEYLEFERKSESKHKFIDGEEALSENHVLTESAQEAFQAMLATENALKAIWDTPEEDEAWSHL